MKKTILFITALLISVFCFSQVQKSITTNGNKMDYWEFEKPKDKKYPVIIFLHGLGEKGSMQSVLNAGLPRALVNGLKIDFIVLAPRSGSGWFDPKLYVQPLIDYYRTLPNVDPDKIYLTGLSAGGHGVYWYMTSAYDGIAAYIPISINSSSFTPLTNKGRPVWHFHGAKDTDPNTVKTSEGFINKYNSVYVFGAQRTVFTNLGHNSWDAVYNSQFTQPTQTGTPSTLYTPFDKSIYEWLLQYSLNPVIIEPPPPPKTVYLKMDSVIVENDRAWTTATDGSVYSWDIKQE